MNARKHRQGEQAKETDRLEPKGTQPDQGLLLDPTRTPRLPVYRADLNHPVNVTEHGNAAGLGTGDRADLTVRRVRGSSIGMTEEAKASM